MRKIKYILEAVAQIRPSIQYQGILHNAKNIRPRFEPGISQKRSKGTLGQDIQYQSIISIECLGTIYIINGKQQKVNGYDTL
jgi:hypothetical protein